MRLPLPRAFRPSAMIRLAIPVFLVGFVVAAIVFFQQVNSRSYLIDATAMGSEITFKGGTNSWYLGGATLCMARGIPRFTALPGKGPCNPQRFETETGVPLTEPIQWPSGSRVGLAVYPGDGTLAVTLLSDNAVKVGEQDIGPGSVILMDKTAWQKNGALAFSGEAEIGGKIGSGATGYLLDGRYEARERSVLGGSSYVVQNGPLARGESVQVFQGKGPALGFGYVTPSFNSDEPGFHLSFVSEKGTNALRLSHFGVPEPVVLKPSWIDTALKSPVIVAISAILAVVSAVAQIVSTEQGETSSAEAGEASDRVLREAAANCRRCRYRGIMARKSRRPRRRP